MYGGEAPAKWEFIYNGLIHILRMVRGKQILRMVSSFSCLPFLGCPGLRACMLVWIYYDSSRAWRGFVLGFMFAHSIAAHLHYLGLPLGP